MASAKSGSGTLIRRRLPTSTERLPRFEKVTLEQELELRGADAVAQATQHGVQEAAHRSPHTGVLVTVDTIFVSTLSEVGKVHLQSVMDCQPLRLGGAALPRQAADNDRAAGEQ